MNLKIRIVNLDHFLDFWSHYNQTIIQSLIVVTLLFIVALIFITLFGNKSEDSGGASIGVSPELEKTLQKMLENQTKAAVFDFSKSPDASVPSNIAEDGAVSPAGAEVLVQLEKLKAEMAKKESQIKELNTKLSEAASQSTKELKVEGGNSELEAKIKELEARLAEYDIISEDIADLSRYKEENEKLKTDLAALKGGGSAGGNVPPQAPPAASAPPTQAPPEAPPQAAAAAPQTPAVEPAAEVAAPQPTPAAPAPSAEEMAAIVATDATIDDDLMKEFAAAVEGQKAATQAAAQPAAPAPASAENEDLMGQFENFVQKKEGT